MIQEEQQRLHVRLASGKTEGLPQFSGPWHQASEMEDWRIFIVHDPCHDDDEGFVDDRNTVIGLHDGDGTYRIIGRELPYEFACALAEGKR